MEVYKRSTKYDSDGGRQNMTVMEVYQRSTIDSRPLPHCHQRRLALRDGQAEPVLLALRDERRISNRSRLGARQKELLSLRDSPRQLRLGDAPRQLQLTGHQSESDASRHLQLTVRKSDSDRHPVKEEPLILDFRIPALTAVTPKWDNFMQNLSMVTNDAHGREFAEFLHKHCFYEKLLWVNANGDWLDFELPFALKMEQLFDVAWNRRKYVLKRLRKGCNLAHADETYEIPEEDMPQVWQLRLLSDVF